MPIAAISEGASRARSIASLAAPIWELQVSSGSCSTQPGRGKICLNSFWAIDRTAPVESTIIARELVVP
jgi:hypothetical protein